jgi:prepilin-type N-terminal cleavage/methylation domain-containing protein
MNTVSQPIRTAKPKRSARRQAGLTLTESLLVLAVAGLIAVVAYGGYKVANSDVQANDLGRGAVTLAGQIKRVNFSAGYASVSPATVKDLVPAGWKYDGTNVKDNFGNTVGLSGSASSFAMVFSDMSATDCQKVVSQFEGVATKVHIGADAAGAAGVVSGGNVYKAANGTITAAALATGCGEDARKIAIEVR